MSIADIWSSFMRGYEGLCFCSESFGVKICEARSNINLCFDKYFDKNKHIEFIVL